MYFGIGRIFREKAGFSRHMPLGFPRHPLPEFSRHPPPHKATKIRNDRVTVSDGSGRTYRPRY